MPDIDVSEYAMTWRPQDNKGRVFLHLQDGQPITIACDSAEELAALAAILKASSVTYRTEDGTLSTGKESI